MKAKKKIQKAWDVWLDICQCTPEKPCTGIDFSNIASKISCGSHCKAKEKCQNKFFTKLTKPFKYELFQSKEKGHGLKAREEILEGEFIIEYVGEVLDDEDIKDKSKYRTR